MNKYESVIIIKPSLIEDEIKKTINKYKENFEKLSNKPVTIEELGKKNLAYEIKGNKEGIYVIFNFNAKSEDISKIEENYRTDDNVMKFITVKLDRELENDESMDNEDEYEI